MPKRQSRPWDKGCHFKDKLAQAEAVLAVPSIKFDGITYKSDRFYLHALENESSSFSSSMLVVPNPNSNLDNSSSCSCGAKNAPPLFPRERFLQSLDLKAAIFGTYTLDINWMARTFPNLIGPSSSVPTLIFRGHKGTTITNLATTTTTTTTAVEPKRSKLDEKETIPTPEKIISTKPLQQQVANNNNAKSTNFRNRQIPSINFFTHNNGNDNNGSLKFGCDEDNEEDNDNDDDGSFKTQEDSMASPQPFCKLGSPKCLSVDTSVQKRNNDTTTTTTTTTTTSNKRNGIVPPCTRLFSSSTFQDDFTPPTKTATASATTAESSFLGKHCHITKIFPAWKPTGDAKVSHETIDSDDDDDNDGNNKKRSKTKNNDIPRETKRGVHHPKFMLLFETSGDLIVVVSTANLTRTSTLEGSWMQRFRIRRRRNITPPSLFLNHSASSRNNRNNNSHNNNGIMTNDFGPVLVDFLEQISLSPISRQADNSSSMTIGEFMKKYLSMDDWKNDLALQYHFEKAQVHLVPVIPGNWRGDRPRKTQPYLYGRQRIQYLQSQLPDLIQSKKDALILQPTSFGGNWKQSELADVVRSYLGCDKENRPKEYWDEDALLKRVRVLWPSYNWMKKISCDNNKNNNNTKNNHTESQQTDSSIEGIVFLSTQTFNSCEKSCLARMALYKSSEPCQRTPLVPHFKSVARIYRPSKRVANKTTMMNNSDCSLSWFLLTSACFSLGAQGKGGIATTTATTTTTLDSSSSSSFLEKKKDPPVEYANFELGVLFTSRSGTGATKRGQRMYCFHPHRCSCELGVLSDHGKLIHLPIPYSLEPEPYIPSENDEDDFDFDHTMKETPFFHEIDDGSRCIGNMLLTPYGIEQQEKQSQSLARDEKRTKRKDETMVQFSV